jgi:hypothetical protein
MKLSKHKAVVKKKPFAAYSKLHDSKTITTPSKLNDSFRSNGKANASPRTQQFKYEEGDMIRQLRLI